MTSENPKPSHIERQRVPLESKVSLKFKEFRGFITEYSRNISLGGMFIVTDQPQPPGSVFDFEFKLADEFSLIHGIAEVVWMRAVARGEEHPAGMGVRFLHLDGSGEKLIRRMVQEHVERGGIPFELGIGDVEDDARGEEVERRQLQEDLAAFQPSPRALGVEASDDHPAVLSDTVVLNDPIAAGDPDPAPPDPVEPTPSLEFPPAATPAPDSVPVAPPPASPEILSPLPEPETADKPLPPGFDEVTRALGKRGPGVIFSSQHEPPAEPEAEPSIPTSPETTTFAAPAAPTPAPSPVSSSGAWQVPDPIDPYPEPRKKGGNGLLILVAAVVGILFAGGYWFSTHRDDTPPFASEALPDQPSIDLGPAPAASGVTDEPAETVDEPPSLESLVGLPEVGEEERDDSAQATSPVPDDLVEPVEPAPGPTATRLEDVRWREEDRSTVVTLVGNGTFQEASLSSFRLQGGQPREVVRVRGIEGEYRQPVVGVGSPTVRQVRFGHHVRGGAHELHVVFDLEHIDAKLYSVTPRGNELIVTLGPT